MKASQRCGGPRLDGADGQARQPSDLALGQATEVGQDEDLAVGRRQGGEGAPHGASALFANHRVGRLDGWLADVHRSPAHASAMSLFASNPVDCLMPHQTHQPRLGSGPRRVVAMPIAPGRDECLLRHVPSEIVVSHDRPGGGLAGGPVSGEVGRYEQLGGRWFGAGGRAARHKAGVWRGVGADYGVAPTRSAGPKVVRGMLAPRSAMGAIARVNANCTVVRYGTL